MDLFGSNVMECCPEGRQMNGYRSIALVLGALAAVSFTGAANSQIATAERPQIKPSDTWAYSFKDTRYATGGCVYSLLVKEVASDGFRAQLGAESPCAVGISSMTPEPPGSIQAFDQDLNHYFKGKPYQTFLFPLAIGKTWTQVSSYVINGWTYNYEVDARVASAEKITVPAGTFDTLKITIRRTYRGEKTGGPTQAGWIDDTFWYAPAAKNYVRRTYEDHSSGYQVSPSPVIRELVKYTVQ
jgi:hypothetical protein